MIATSENIHFGDNTANIPTVADLQNIYPQYFWLNTTNGLDVYVWQMSADSYSRGLLPVVTLAIRMRNYAS